MLRAARNTILSMAVTGMILFCAAAPAAFGAGDKDKTITGEVLDHACYIMHGAKGKGHADCAKACAKGGQPMGLLADDGKVYLLVAAHDNMKPYEEAKDLAGALVEVKGEVGQKGELQAIEVHAIKAK